MFESLLSQPLLSFPSYASSLDNAYKSLDIPGSPSENGTVDKSCLSGSRVRKMPATCRMPECEDGALVRDNHSYPLKHSKILAQAIHAWR